MRDTRRTRAGSGSSIAVTGLGAISGLGAGVEALWDGLLSGACAIAPIRAFDASGCRVGIAAEAPNPLPNPEGTLWGESRTVRLALAAAGEAIADARLTPQDLLGAGLVFGSTAGGDAALEAFLQGRRDGRPSRALFCGYPKRVALDTVGRVLGVGGPRALINTACSSGLVALLHAQEWLHAGLCDVALAGGVDPLTRYTLTGFASLRALDPEPCRPFDRARRGLSLGEGAGILVLETLAHAKERGARPHALFAGLGHTCDASHLTAPDEEGRGAARAMNLALEQARVRPEEIGFVNAHGTGTLHNDRAEIRAIVAALGSTARRCGVHSVKATIGHCLGAAGALETIVGILSLRHGMVPATRGLVEPEASDQVRFVIGEPMPMKSPFGLSNSFGFGGNNASVLLARPEDEP